MVQDIKNQTRIILDSIADGVFTVDADWKITSFNRAAEKITGIKKEEAVGRYCWEVFKASICEKGCSLKRTVETKRPIINQHIFIVNSKGDRVPISISTAILKDKSGNVIGGVETFRDLSVEEQLRKELARQHTFFDIISKNREMQRLFEMLELVAEHDAGIVLMHMRGEPRTMQRELDYCHVVAEVHSHLIDRAAAAMAAGVPRERVWLDPGIGFGKDDDGNLALLAALPDLAAHGHPVLVGPSNKSFIGRLTGAPVGDRLPGTLGALIAVLDLPRAVVRVHDAAAAVQFLEIAVRVREVSA